MERRLQGKSTNGSREHSERQKRTCNGEAWTISHQERLGRDYCPNKKHQEQKEQGNERDKKSKSQKGKKGYKETKKIKSACKHKRHAKEQK